MILFCLYAMRLTLMSLFETNMCWSRRKLIELLYSLPTNNFSPPIKIISSRHVFLLCVSHILSHASVNMIHVIPTHLIIDTKYPINFNINDCKLYILLSPRAETKIENIPNLYLPCLTFYSQQHDNHWLSTMQMCIISSSGRFTV